MTVKDQPQDTALQVHEAQDVAVTNPAQLLAMAVSQDLDIEKLERLMVMQERYDEKQARKSFYEAMARFQAEMPEIRKTSSVDFTSRRTGERTNYNYAGLGAIISQVKEPLSNNGLSYRWIYAENGEIKVEFVVTHIDGHSESTFMTAPADTSGNKNAVQSKASTTTYLKRHTMIGGLGIGTADEDNDAVDDPTPTPETPPQWTLPALEDFSSDTPIWLGDYKGQAFGDLSDDYLESMVGSLGSSTNMQVIRAQEYAEKEIDERKRAYEEQSA